MLKEAWVNEPLPQLNAAAIAEYRDRRLASVKPATLKRQLNIVKHACATAEREWDWLSPLSMLQRITLPKNAEHVVRRITVTDEQALINAAKESRTKNLFELLILAIETAMRRGELLALGWQDIDLERRELLVRRSKNGKSRVIPLTPRAHKTLTSMTTDNSDLLFRLSGNAVRLSFDRVRKRAGLEHIRFHDLRHEAISRFFELGLTHHEVSSISGHKSADQLFHYSHHNIDLIQKKFLSNRDVT